MILEKTVGCRHLAQALGLLLMFVVPAQTVASQLFKIEDIRGDDHGAGEIIYPGRFDFEKGDLDLLWISARSVSNGTWFSARFQNPIRDPKQGRTDVGPEPLDSIARLGFYTFNIDIYIDQDRIEGSGNINTLPGREVEIDQRHAWEKSVILTPRPIVARSLLEQHLQKMLEESTRAEKGRVSSTDVKAIKTQITQQLENNFYFPTIVKISRRKINFFVPHKFLGSPASADWSYVILVTGAHLYSRMNFPGISHNEFNLMMMPVDIGRPMERFGLQADADPGQPAIIDIASNNKNYQAQALSDYDTISGRIPRLVGVIPSGHTNNLVLKNQATSVNDQSINRDKNARKTTPEGISKTSPGIDQMLEKDIKNTSSADHQGAAERLRSLKQLKQEGLVTEQEYQQIRRKILSEL